MYLSLSFNQFLALTRESERIAVYQQIRADQVTPITIFKALADEMQQGVMFESGLRHETDGRYSYFAFDVIGELQIKAQQITSKPAENANRCSSEPLSSLREFFRQYHCVSSDEVTEVLSHVIGFFSYDAVRYFEKIADQHEIDKDLPDILFKFYRNSLIFDHHQQTLLMSTIVENNEAAKKSYQKAHEKITALLAKIMAPSLVPQEQLPLKNRAPSKIEVDLDDQAFIELVIRAKNYIQQGEAFQIVLSRVFKQSYTAKPFDIYRVLRQVSPAPYMFYLPLKDRLFIGASPERMLAMKNQELTINPIAGTRKRGVDSEDEVVSDELSQDQKERAEHMMLVDLARNDIGAVCQPGSVYIKELLQVKHYSHVSHLTSEIKGKLDENCDALTALASTFPAGTLSGAPKIRAMNIIDELEASRRGMYGGAIYRMNLKGDIESFIAIRMAELKAGVATVRAGAGIVYDSDPEKEVQETTQKAQTVLEAISIAESMSYDFTHR